MFTIGRFSRPAMAPHQTRPGSWSRHSFGVTVRLTPTREEFAVRSVRPDMLVSELQDHAEFATGIPVHMQQLCYLDEGGGDGWGGGEGRGGGDGWGGGNWWGG